jgi:hypothetical protein
MKSYLAVIAMDIKLALRLRAVVFFNYIFPLIFFFTFATVLKGSKGDMAFVVTMSVTLGVLGSGFFGAGIRAIQERELGILRRYKVTPITPAPLLVGSMITGWIIFIPYIALLLLMAHFIYGMPLPLHFFELLAFISLGLIAFRALGLVRDERTKELLREYATLHPEDPRAEDRRHAGVGSPVVLCRKGKEKGRWDDSCAAIALAAAKSAANISPVKRCIMPEFSLFQLSLLDVFRRSRVSIHCSGKKRPAGLEMLPVETRISGSDGASSEIRKLIWNRPANPGATPA